MKKLICTVLPVLLVVLSGCSGKKAEKKAVGEFIESGFAGNDTSGTAYETAAENEKLEMRINPDTTDFEIIIKSTGAVWSSSGGIAEEGRGALFSFTYLDASGVTATMNSMADSVEKGQYSIEKNESGATVTYSFGDIANDLIYPVYISAERFEEFTGKMSSYSKATVTSLYRHLAPDLYTDEMYEDFLQTYPKARDKDVYILRNEDMLLNARKQLSAAFEEAGYNAEELERDCEEFDISASVTTNNSFQFNITVEYTLDGDDLVVTLPGEGLYWNDAADGIEKLSVLQYFGSPPADDEGYFLIPDGSGSLMDFYNGKETAGQTVNTALYGENHSITQNESIYSLNQAIMPVFGIKKQNSACFAVIEKGDAIASINAVSGTNTLSARIWPDFSIKDTQQVYPKSLSDSGYYENASYTREQSEPYSGDIKIRYHFMTGEDADYSGMAVWYGNYLFGDSRTGESVPPLYTEIVSSVDYKKTSAGFTYNVIKVLTDFSEAGEIAADAAEESGAREKLILSGWQDTGWRSGYADKLKISSEAGGEDSFSELKELADENGIEFFPDIDLQFVYQSAIGSGVKKELVSRTLVQQLSKVYEYNLSDYQKADLLAYAMTPEYTAESLDNVIREFSELGISSLSLRGLAEYIIPDYSENDVTDREETKEMLSGAVAQHSENGSRLLSRTGNVPFGSNMSDIVELPLISTRNNNCMYEVPFTAMVYSGRIDYAAGAVNLSGASRSDILKLIECNSGVYFITAGSTDDNLKDSYFSKWYSIKYDDIKESVLSVYKEVKQALEGNYGLTVKKHERLADNVYKTVFENGNYVIVNYNGYGVTVGGTEVPAENYVRGAE